MKHCISLTLCLAVLLFITSCEKPSDTSAGQSSPTVSVPRSDESVASKQEPLDPSPSIQAPPSSASPQRIFASDTIGQILKDTVGKPFGQLTAEELEAFTTLDLQQKEIDDLSGLERLQNLESLSVGQNQISSVAPLAGLEYLTQVDISSNRVTDATALGQIPNLTSLSAGGNQIESVSGLAGLKNLKHLAISDNPITEASPIGKITTLQTLQLSDTMIRSVEGLEALSVLEELYLANTMIQDVTPLHSLKKLKRLNLHGTFVSLGKIAALKAAVPGLEIAHDPEPQMATDCESP
jgi:Leucine-rich repeat (LRR) protein